MVAEGDIQQHGTHEQSKPEFNTNKQDVEGTVSLSTPPSSEFKPVVTVKTWIVVMFLSWGYGLCFWPIPTFAAIGALVTADFGQADAYVWFVPAWGIATTVAFMVCGANTDLLGRRWFLVGGNLLCVIGHLLVGTAKETKSAEQITAGMVLSGFGAGLCQMAAFSLPELLPNKWRHISIIIADGTVYIAILIAPVTARYGYQFDNWEWNFYGPAVFQFVSFMGLLFLYFPPAHPAGLPIRQAVKRIDYPGILLFTAGCVPVLMGIVWAGIYRSSDAHVVAPLVVGFFFLVCFGLWETYGGAQYPIAPPHIFSKSWGRDFTAPALALTITNMFYYSSSILWPTMITTFYTDGGADWQYAVVLSLPQGFAICFGAFLLICLGSFIKHWQWQLTTATFLVVLFGSLLGLATPQNMDLMLSCVFLSQTAFAWAIPLSIMLSQLGVEHKDLGISGGISGSMRFAGGAVATSVYQAIFNNTVREWTPKLVIPAVLKAGLDEAKVTELLSALSTPALSTSFSPAVVVAATEALKQAYCKAIFVVAMSSMGFGVIAIIACLSCKDVDSKMTNTIDVYMENTEYADRNKFH